MLLCHGCMHAPQATNRRELIAPDPQHGSLPELAALRPDILIIEGLASCEVQHLTDNEIRALIEQRKGVKILILEIGFCSDLRHGERDGAKKQPHERLCQILSGRSPGNGPAATPSKHRTTTPSDAMRRRTERRSKKKTRSIC